MGYGLGVDLGTTFTAAAVERDGHVEMVTLGDRSAAVPSVVLVRDDGRSSPAMPPTVAPRPTPTGSPAR